MNWIDQAIPPLDPEATASAFANWVFSQTTPEKHFLKKDDHEKKRLMELGSITHENIDLFFQTRWTRDTLGKYDTSEWTLEFSDNKLNAKKVFLAKSLRIHGNALRCRPDVILRNNKINQILIIERKTTFVPEEKIPERGWPNIEAQLWCYSWIDDLADVDEILLVGQIWNRPRTNAVQLVGDKNLFWKKSDRNHHQRCLKWFKKFGGEFVKSPISK